MFFLTKSSISIILLVNRIPLRLRPKGGGDALIGASLAYIKDNYSRNPQKVQVERTEEKGSDVNLAALLIYDNCTSDNDESVVISNDSDLTLAIELVTRDLGKEVVVVNPNRTRMATKYKGCRMQNDLKRVATRSVLSINEAVLAKSRFPDILEDSKGNFHKPDKW